MTIWKFKLALVSKQTIELPEGSEILSVQEQAGELCLWAKVNPNMQKVGIKIMIVGTGHQIGFGVCHIGTVVTEGGSLVWHVFEEF